METSPNIRSTVGSSSVTVKVEFQSEIEGKKQMLVGFGASRLQCCQAAARWRHWHGKVLISCEIIFDSVLIILMEFSKKMSPRRKNMFELRFSSHFFFICWNTKSVSCFIWPKEGETGQVSRSSRRSKQPGWNARFHQHHRQNLSVASAHTSRPDHRTRPPARLGRRWQKAATHKQNQIVQLLNHFLAPKRK